jgi:hypothetical protein
MTIGIPDMSAMPIDELEKLKLDAEFQVGVCEAFLLRAQSEIKRRKDEVRKQRREGLAPEAPRLNTKVH